MNHRQLFGPALAALLALTPLGFGGEAADSAPTAEQALMDQARQNGIRFDRSAVAIRRVLDAWRQRADPRTSLLPDSWKTPDECRVQNAQSDLWPHLVLTSYVTDRDLYNVLMLKMLRNEVRYTTATDSVPGDLDLVTGQLDPMDLFGAAEYAKDGLVSITELAGRGPWFYRMADLIVDVMNHAAVPSAFGNLPDFQTEMNGDLLQVLVRLANMTGDRRYIEWARRIGDAYVKEVLPGNHGLPSMSWDFQKHTGDTYVHLRDHGNETIVGLSLLFAYEQYHQTPRAAEYRPVLANMFDRILESANPDGLLYNGIDARTLTAAKTNLNDNWGYVYGAVYAFYQATGEEKYRDAVRRVLKNLPKYKDAPWERGRMDGCADALESGLYLLAKEPLPEAADWVDYTAQLLASKQEPSGNVVNTYLDGNFNRSMLLYALYNSKGCRPEPWMPGLRVGAARDGDRLYLSIETDRPARRWKGRICFDHARHKRVMNFDKDYVRLNMYPEWYTVDENTLYRVRGPKRAEEILLGSELIRGIPLAPGSWIVEPVGKPPYGPSNMPAAPGGAAEQARAG